MTHPFSTFDFVMIGRNFNDDDQKATDEPFQLDCTPDQKSVVEVDLFSSPKSNIHDCECPQKRQYRRNAEIKLIKWWIHVFMSAYIHLVDWQWTQDELSTALTYIS